LSQPQSQSHLDLEQKQEEKLTLILNFDRKLSEATAGLQPFYSRMLSSIGKDENISKTNSSTIIDFILAMKAEKNHSLHYRGVIIKTLVKLCRFSFKTFKDMTRQDILAFLDSYRKTDAADPLHKWIGTYNLHCAVLVTFFKWLHYPDMEPKRRPKPSVVDNIPKLKRKETSIYKPTDLWTCADDLLFLKYCPSKRDRCYHAIPRDLSCRPAEILDLRIKDISFKTNGSYQYAEVTVNGKTGTRPIPLISSIPYLKDWLDEHMQRGNPNAFLIPTFERRNYGRKMTVAGLNDIYCMHYRKQFFPRLLEDPSITPEDKQRIKELLHKPWNPYIRRHSALTEKSTILKEHVLRRHAGWSPRSQMHLKYLHYFGNESSESLLEAYGIVNADERADIFVLKPKQCPNCNEPNKVDSKFCAKCRMVLSYDAYSEVVSTSIETSKFEQKLNRIEKKLKNLGVRL
jgi:integrase/recombinase XerD